MNRTTTQVRSYLALMLLAAAPKLMAQATPQAPATDAAEETITLDPFSVTAAEESDGYSVKDSLAGTRVRTELKDIASSISVVNAQFLKDTGAKNSQDLLVYTTNTEVAGVGGNFSGLGSTFIGGFSQSSFANPSSETRVRGVDSADNTRDYFTTDIPWDSYIVDRVDLQRGPNSILFGVGSPAGIVNTSTNAAAFKTSGKVENRIGSYGSFRLSFDYNQVLLKKELALRVAALDDQTKYRQDPAFNRDRRLYAALRYDPSFLNADWVNTSIKANIETGNVRANRPRYTPPNDHITPFFASTDVMGDAINRRSFDSLVLWQSGYAGITGTPNAGFTNNNYWIGQYKGPGLQTTNNAVVTYANGEASTPLSYRQALPYGKVTLPNGEIQDWGVPYYATMGIVGMSDYSQAANLPGSDAGTWKTYSLTDRGIFDFQNKLIDGPNKFETQKWQSANISLSQTFFNDRLGYQVVYDRQEYAETESRNLNNPYISVDINKYVGTSPIWDSKATLNPYAGYAFTGSGTRDSGGRSRETLRESYRGTLFGEFRASDVFDKNSLATRLLGRHIVTGLYDRNEVVTRNLNWTRYAFGADYSKAVGLGDKTKLTDGSRVLDWVTYLGDTSKAQSASELNLNNITAVQAPSGSQMVTFWDPRYVSTLPPKAETWTNPYASYAKPTTGSVLNGTWNSAANKANFTNPGYIAGWSTRQFDILNADAGDREKLYTTASKLRTKIDSKAFTYQGYLLDEILVPTWGYRRDRVKNQSGYGTTDATSGSILDYDRIGYDPSFDDVVTANSQSWGIVAHLPKSLRKVLPLGTDLSVHYNRGKNTRSEIRYNFDGERLPNSSGKTEEMGFAVTTFNDRLQFKATWYETNVQAANMASTTGQNGTLGSNTYYLYLLPAWGTAHALVSRAGLAGELVSYDGDGNFQQYSAKAPYVWDWAGVTYENQTLSTSAGSITLNPPWMNNDPKNPAYRAIPLVQQQIRATEDWFKYMNMGQKWYDAYGFPVDATAWSKGTFGSIVPKGTFDITNPDIGAVQSTTGGRIRGTYPVGTCDTQSKGVELEMSAQPIKGLNLTFNASRTYATQTALTSQFVAAIEDQYNRLFGTASNPSYAKDMRLWWAGDTDTIGNRFLANIWAPYQFQVQTNGKMASEMSKWRFNAVANYSFSKGVLKGLNTGAGYRWQKAPVIGYLLTDSTDRAWIAQNLNTSSNLDVNLPVYGRGESHVDLWIGYNKQLTKKINWNIQLNLRNVAEKADLVPISVQPLLKSDGTPDYANYRIQDGMTWTLTNTFSF